MLSPMLCTGLHSDILRQGPGRHMLHESLGVVGLPPLEQLSGWAVRCTAGSPTARATAVGLGTGFGLGSAYQQSNAVLLELFQGK
jgi:hypothetical protein